MSDVTIFDRRLLRARRERAAALVDETSPLLTSTAVELVERIALIKRPFPRALALGGHAVLRREIEKCADAFSIEHLITSDLSFGMIKKETSLRVVADEEALPFGPHSLDLVVSMLSLHACNDLPGALSQIRRALKPDGFFLAALFGGDTLTELRQAFAQAELERDGGVSPRIAPFVDVQSMGALLQRAGFALPVVDIDRTTHLFDSPLELFSVLRACGQTNVLLERSKRFLKRATLMRVCENYAEMFGTNEGKIPATFQTIYASGWSPHDSQQQPLVPGSAKTSLADAHKTVEISAGDKAAPTSPSKK